MNNTHSQRASNALRKLAEKDPAFASLALWCKHRDTESVEVLDARSGDMITIDVAHALAWTDGKTIWYSQKFENLTLEEQMTVAAHEISHVAWRHVPRMRHLYERLGDRFSADIFNIASDAIINETLRLSGRAFPPKTGIFLVELFKDHFQEEISAEDSLSKWDVESLYMKLSNKQNQQCSSGQGSGNGAGGSAQQGGGGNGGQQNRNSKSQNQNGGAQQKAGNSGNQDDGQGDGEGQGKGSFFDKLRRWAEERGAFGDLDASAPLTPADSQADSQWQQRIHQAMRQGRKAGTGIGKLDFIIADMPKSRTPWEVILRRLVTKAVTRMPRQTYERPARRWIGAEDDARRRRLPTPAYEPGIVKMNGQPRIAVCVDVSGSIGDDILHIFCGEIAAIGNKTGAEIYVIVFDDGIHYVKKLAGIDFASELRQLKFGRGGGTSFVEPIEEAMKVDPSIIVVLTDLYGPFGPEPKRRVVWASIEKENAQPPFGHLLSLAA